MFLDKALRDSFLAQTRVSKCSPHRRYLLLKRGETLSNMGLMYVLGQYLDYRKRCSISCKTISCILFINSPPPNLQNSTQVIIECSGFPPALQQVLPRYLSNSMCLSFTITNDRQALSWTKRGATIIIFGCAPPGKVSNPS